MNRNPAPSTLPISLHATPNPDPAVPSWLSQATLVAAWFWKNGIVRSFEQQIRVQRGRTGTFSPIDFFLPVLLYAVSQERTLEVFCQVASFWPSTLASFWDRQSLPSRYAISRFLSDFPADQLPALRSLFFRIFSSPV